MKVQRLIMTPEEQALLEYTQALAAKQSAIQDYNIMMGNLEDPSEEIEEDNIDE